MATGFQERRPEIIGNEYFVVGTMDRTDWKTSMEGDLDTGETADRIHVFKDVWNFDIIPGGWYRDGEHPTER